MDRIPFANYDFFGYLASGLVVMAGMELSLGFPHILDKQLTVVQGALMLLSIYVAGQLVATPAKALLEDLLVHRVLGSPSKHLLQAKTGFLRFIFPGYFKPLPKSRRERLMERAKTEGMTEYGEALFLHVRFHPDMLKDDKLKSRLDSFLGQYGFSRNIAFACLVVGVALIVKWHFTHDPTVLRYGVTSLIVFVLLIYRYLKFFRQYSYELFNVYAGGK